MGELTYPEADREMVASLFTPAWVRRIEAHREISKAYFAG
jgi:hypothetical protein